MLKNPEKIQSSAANGLYRKALFYFNKSATTKTAGLSGSSPGRTAGSSIDGITEDEKREIINEIDTLIAQKKTNITPELLVYKPEHLGFFLPLMINLLAAGIVVTAFLLLPFLFEKGFFERTKTSEQVIQNVDSELIEKYKQESAAKISEKEAELNSIQGKMSQLQKEKATLDATFNEQIRKKEDELKKSLQNTIEIEKQKLISQGITKETMTAELKKLELQLRETNTQALDSYKSQIQVELSQKEKRIADLGNQLASEQKALAKIQEQYQQQMSARENALKAREEEIKNREATLLANYQSQKQQLESTLGDVSGQFTRLQKAQQQEQQVHNQLLSYYNQLDTSLKAQDYTKATQQLKLLENFLTKKENADLTFIRERKPTELFLINALKDYIEFKQSDGKKKKDADNALVESIVTTVKEAQQAYKQDDKQKAYKLYTAALEKLPEIKTSYSALQAQNETLHKSELEKLASQITELKKKQAELEANALAMTNELSKLKSESASTLPGDEKRKQLTERLGSMKQQFLSFLEKNKVNASVNNQIEEYSLIQSKLTLKKILASKTVTSQYPELYQDMENYFNNLNEERNNWKAVTEGLITMLDYLNGEVTSKSIQSFWLIYRQESQQNLMANYLANLQSAFKLVQAVHVKKLDELSSAFNGYRKSHKTDTTLSTNETYNLVMAKLAVKKILASEPYATQYPDLYQNLEKYTALLEQEQTVWQNCFQELVYLSSRLNEGFKPADLTPHWPAFRSPEHKELLLGFINTLQALL